MLPPESLAMPMGEPAAAMIAASPLLDAPGERARSYGLRVPPCSGFQLSAPVAPGGQLDFPIRIAPTERIRAMTVASLSGTFSFSLLRPVVVATPAVSKMSLAVKGTPWRGGGLKPRLAILRSAALAWRTALSLVTHTMALRRGLTWPMCWRWARTTSSDDRRPSRMARASHEAGAPIGSLTALDHGGWASRLAHVLHQTREIQPLVSPVLRKTCGMGGRARRCLRA